MISPGEVAIGAAAGVIIQLLTLVIANVLRGSGNAVRRHVLLVSGLLVSLALPFVSALTPESLHVRITPPPGATGPDTLASALGPAVPSARSPHEPIIGPAMTPSGPRTEDHTRRISVAGLALFAYLVGLSLILVRRARDLASLRRARTSAKRDERLRHRAIQLWSAFDTGPREFDLLLSSEIGSPLTFGVIRPSVLLPEQSAHWPGSEIDSILLHELSHLRRYDNMSIWILNLATALYWFSPFAWLMSARARKDAEICTDAMAIEAGKLERRSYGLSLVRIARLLAGKEKTAMAVTMSGSELTRRIEVICSSALPVTRAPKWFSAAVVSVLFAAGLLVSSPRLAAAAPLDSREGQKRISSDDTVAEIASDDADVARELIHIIRSDPGPEVRRAAVQALSRSPLVDSREAQAALLASLSDPSPDVRISAEIALGLRLDAPNKVFGDSGRVPRTAATVEEVAREMTSPKAAIRLRAIRTLDGTDDPEAVELIERTLLDDESDVVRADAASILERVGDDDSVLVLIEALRDSSWRVRQFAAGSLGDFHDSRATLPLTALLDDPDEHVRLFAAASLGDIGDRAALPALVNATLDRNEHVRRCVVDSLGDIGDRRAIPALIRAMREDESADVRQSAVNSIDEIRAARSRR